MKYDAIINLPHYELKNHPRMSMDSRAAQFAPFAALEGHEEALEETARLTSQRRALSQSEKAELSRHLNMIAKGISRACRIVYFIPDSSKNGGSYREVEGLVKKLDLVERKIFLHGGIVVELDMISELELLA